MKATRVMSKVQKNDGWSIRNPDFKPSNNDSEDSGVSTDNNRKSTQKRKIKKDEFKRPKKQKTDHLTVEQINELKETSELYHSNIFRMQIDETLKEVQVKTKPKEFLDKWLATFTKFLDKLPKDDLTQLAKHKNFPLKFRPMEKENKLQMSYQPPTNVAFRGSHALGTSIGMKSLVDVFLTMPNEILRREDYVNQIYFHKRALYLLHVAQKLEEKGTLGGNIKHMSWKNDPLKPVILVEAEDFMIAISAIPSSDYFKTTRFVPRLNNIKFRTGQESVVPTPHYNFQILADCVVEKNHQLLMETIGKHENLKNAVKLLKIWLHQRQFDAGFYPIGGFEISCYTFHLLKIKKIYPTMSCYQIIRLFWNHFGHSKLDGEVDFYDTNFLDPSGQCNILSLVSVDFYRRVRDECLLAIQILDDRSINSFHQLFMVQIPFYTQYDHVATLKYDEKFYKSIIERHGALADKINYHNMMYPHLRKMLIDVLRKGLDVRVKFIVPISQAGSDELTFGLVLNPETAFDIVDKGPQANDPEAENFRKTWGQKAEIRRFKDGSITESVLWCRANAPIAEKRLISQKIFNFLLKHHFNVISDKISYSANQFDVTIKNIFNELSETNEERSLLVIKTFDEVSKELRGLLDLPLEIVSVLGTDPVFRYADITPPLDNASSSKTGLIGKFRGVFRAQKVLNGIIQLSASGKWPDDLDAMRRIKAAFYIEIQRKMSQQFPETYVNVSSNSLEVLKKKVLFRLKIVHPKEVALEKQEISSSNNLTKLFKTNEHSLRLEFEGTAIPKLTSTLHGFHHQHPSFGPTVAIAKRWLYSHMLDSSLFPDEATELLIAGTLLRGWSPLQPQTGFFKFLHLLAHFNENEMFVVNFNEELSVDELEELEKKFQKTRKNFPPMFIVTPCDFGNHGIWTSKAPTENILQRIKILARHSIEIISKNSTKLTTGIVKDLFTPAVDGYDLVINVKQDFVRRHDVVISNFTTFKPLKFENKGAPPADVNFVEKFLEELRNAYNDFALFFYNPVGGSQIAMLWKPTVRESKEFVVSHVNGCELENGRVRVNINAIVKDIQIIGNGLVSSIEIAE